MVLIKSTSNGEGNYFIKKIISINSETDEEPDLENDLMMDLYNKTQSVC